MKNLVLTILTLLLIGSICFNVNLALLSQQNKQYKLRILELQEKRNNTASIALKTVYNDSINYAVKCWLYDDSSK